MDDAQAEMKVRRNNNLRYIDDTTMAEEKKN